MRDELRADASIFLHLALLAPARRTSNKQMYLVTRHPSRLLLQCRSRLSATFSIMAQHFHTPPFWMLDLQTCRCPLSQSSALAAYIRQKDH